jgi:levansucrase
VYDQERGTLDVLYTAAGGRDPAVPQFTQRIVATSARVLTGDGAVRCVDWTPHREVLGADGVIYARTDAEHGEPGFIKAFRDPFPLHDPASGADRVLFCASLAASTSSFNGAVGVATALPGGGYRLDPPLLSADGVNNELERPHMVVHDGAHYLFFSTQRHTFAPGIEGPTGLYGFVAPALGGPYEPLNGSGLVLRNPDAEPTQAYSWLVLPDLRVVSFADLHSLAGLSPAQVAAGGPGLARRHFGGTLAPVHRLRLAGATATVEGR